MTRQGGRCINISQNLSKSPKIPQNLSKPLTTPPGVLRLSAIDKNSTVSARVRARESQGRVYKKFMIANGIPQKINI